MFKRHRCSRTLVITVIVALTYTLACNIFTLYHLSKSKQNSFVHKYGLLYLGHLNTFRNWTCKPVGLSKVGLPLTALASYPGSGNTWLRHLLQQSTGISTGSEYIDYSLKLHGFPSEGISNTSVLVVKTHEYGNVTLNKYERAILLIREPKEALLAEFNRRHAGHHGHAQKIDFRREWNNFLFDEMENWYQFNMRWLQFPRPLHVIMYDQLKSNTSTEIVALLKFLNLTITNKELLCVLRNVNGHFKRPGGGGKSAQQLFTQSIQRMMDNQWKDISNEGKKRQANLSIS